MAQTQQQYKVEVKEKEKPEVTYAKRAVYGYSSSIVSGILVLINGIVLAAVGSVVSGIIPAMWSGLASTATAALGAVGIVFGILILIGSGLTYYRRERAGGVLTLIFSILSVAVGGGFIIGEILGIAGGSLSVARK